MNHSANISVPQRSIWEEDDLLMVLDQTRLPHQCVAVPIKNLHDAVVAISNMQVRGAPLIGVVGAYGVALALKEDPSDTGLTKALQALASTRPTAVNLHWALRRIQTVCAIQKTTQRAATAWAEAQAIADEDMQTNRTIGEYGFTLIEGLAADQSKPVRLMTHCNAGWLATTALGTALAPIYLAHQAGIPLHIIVSETRPRNQGLLTAWELSQAGVPYTLIADNAAGLLMQQGKVDMVIVGADRIAANGDTANKVGTYLKALAAHAHGIPFYIAAPRSTIDLNCPNGAAIPIESRHNKEVYEITGLKQDTLCAVDITPAQTPITNPAFDVTPATLITGIITEHGIIDPHQLTTHFHREHP